MAHDTFNVHQVFTESDVNPSDPTATPSYDYVAPPNDNLVCTICQSVFTDPVTLPCRHTLCRLCVEALVQNNEASGKSTECPLDRKVFTEDQVKSAPVAFQNLVNELLVYCPLRDRGCAHLLQRQALTDHLARQCPLVMVACHHPDCKETRPREIMGSHLRYCPWGSVGCLACQKFMEQTNQNLAVYPRSTQQNEDSSSEVTEIPCKFCGQKVTPDQVIDHQTQCSANQSYRCDFSEYGCRWVGTTEDALRTHLVEECRYQPLAGLIQWQEQRHQALQWEQWRNQQTLTKLQALVDQLNMSKDTSPCIGTSSSLLSDQIPGDRPVTELPTSQEDPHYRWRYGIYPPTQPPQSVPPVYPYGPHSPFMGNSPVYLTPFNPPRLRHPSDWVMHSGTSGIHHSAVTSGGPGEVDIESVLPPPVPLPDIRPRSSSELIGERPLGFTTQGRAALFTSLTNPSLVTHRSNIEGPEGDEHWEWLVNELGYLRNALTWVTHTLAQQDAQAQAQLTEQQSKQIDIEREIYTLRDNHGSLKTTVQSLFGHTQQLTDVVLALGRDRKLDPGQHRRLRLWCQPRSVPLSTTNASLGSRGSLTPPSPAQAPAMVSDATAATNRRLSSAGSDSGRGNKESSSGLAAHPLNQTTYQPRL
ncbi:Ubiquitin conjugation factor E4 [Dispira simplex]|nr:Ubiquitin conjugation factor E4 [Dispira simplex]